MRVEDARKINTDVLTPPPSRVRLPFTSKVPAVYAPGVIVRPPPSSTTVVVPARLSASAADAAVNAAMEEPPRTWVPEIVMVPVGATALPTPISPPAVPVIPLGVALVIPAFARTPYVDAAPIEIGASTAFAVVEIKPIPSAVTEPITRNLLPCNLIDLRLFIVYSNLGISLNIKEMF